MSDALDPALKKLLDAAKWPEPPPELEARLLPSLQSAWAASAGGAVLLGKLGAYTTVAALAVGLGGGAWLHAEFAEPKVAPAAVVVPAPVAPPVALAPALAPEAPRVVAVPPPPQQVRPALVRPTPVTPVLTPPIERPQTVDVSLAEEHRLLQMARAALLRREPELALSPLREHATRFPGGQLAEERASLEIQALGNLGRGVEARAQAAEFHRRYPDSLLGAGVDAVLSTLSVEKK